MILQKQTFDELSIANTRVRLFLMAVGLALLTHTGLMSAEPVRVLYTEGSDESSQASAGLSKRNHPQRVEEYLSRSK